MNFTIDPWSIMAILVVLVIAFIGIRMLKQRLDEQRYQEQLAELEFNERLFSNAETSAEPSSQELSVSPLNTDAKQPVDFDEPGIIPGQIETSAPTQKSNIVNDDSEPQAADVMSAKIVNQLTQADMLTSVEGYIELHGNPKGAAILRLRTGKMALLVPHMESEAFLRRHARRVDMIILTKSDGKAVVVTPLEDLISQNIVPR